MNLHSELLSAISKEQKSKIYDILVGQRVEPTVECLQIAIQTRNNKLIEMFFGYPYFLRPTSDCLAEAIRTNHSGLLSAFLQPKYNIVPNEACLLASIEKANVDMVRYILQKCPRLTITTSHINHIDDLQFEEYNQEIQSLLQEAMDRQMPKPLPFDFLV